MYIIIISNNKLITKLILFYNKINNVLEKIFIIIKKVNLLNKQLIFKCCSYITKYISIQLT